MNIADAIAEEALKLIRRHQCYASDLFATARRRARETGQFRSPEIQVPGYWQTDRGFNPYYVSSRAARIGAAIRASLNSGAYRPYSAAEYGVPKPDGGLRNTSVFQVADNAVSRLVFKSLMAKNAVRLSPRCYAFRTDIGRHDALFYVYQQLRTRFRLYVAEFDFRQFFDSLKHDNLLRVLASGQFIVTRREQRIVEAFLRTPSLPMQGYSRRPRGCRERGIPQGTSISLFLANIAAFPLDQQLERLGVGFARYADDTLVWSSRYDEVCRAVDAIAESCEQMGVSVHHKKSPGISLLLREGEASEVSGKSHVQYLGVSISKDCMSIKPGAVSRIKAHISYVLYRALIQPLRNGQFQADRIRPPVDRSYVTALFQIRRYLYGGLSEAKLRRYAAGIVPSIRFYGVLAASPLVDDDAQLRALDGWLVHTAWAALRLRARLTLLRQNWDEQAG